MFFNLDFCLSSDNSNCAFLFFKLVWSPREKNTPIFYIALSVRCEHTVSLALSQSPKEFQGFEGKKFLLFLYISKAVKKIQLLLLHISNPANKIPLSSDGGKHPCLYEMVVTHTWRSFFQMADDLGLLLQLMTVFLAF